jgi:hypothetical protein
MAIGESSFMAIGELAFLFGVFSLVVGFVHICRHGPGPVLLTPEKPGNPWSVVYLRLSSAVTVGLVLFVDFARTWVRRRVFDEKVVMFTHLNWAFIFLTTSLGTVRQVLALRGRCCQLLAEFHAGMFATVLTFAPFVSFCTWAVLLPHSFLIGEQERFLNPISYWEHMGNTVLCVAEFLFVRPNLPWQLVACPVLFVSAYFLTSMFCQLALGSPSPYFFLDARSGTPECLYLSLALVPGTVLIYLPWYRAAAARAPLAPLICVDVEQPAAMQMVSQQRRERRGTVDGTRL